MNFCKIHVKGKPVLLNLYAVMWIIQAQDGRADFIIDGHHNIVDESYEQVKSMICHQDTALPGESEVQK